MMKEQPSPQQGLRCSFCNRNAEEVERLITGPNVHICNECVMMCNDIMNEEETKCVLLSDDCLFCKIASGDIPADPVYSDDHIVAFNDIDPQAPLHVLIIPRRHVPTVADLKQASSATIGRMTHVANHIARQQGLAERGYRLVVNCNAEAGQTVFHLHMHLLGGRAMKWPPG